MAIERLVGYEEIKEVLDCKDYSFSPQHKSILKRIANHIKNFNPTKNAYVIECSKEEAIDIFKFLGR